jgi:hypothetical protein
MDHGRVAARLQALLVGQAEQAAWDTGTCQRTSPLAGATLIQTLVLGFLDEPDASLEDLAQTAALLEHPVTPQALDQRFTPALARCLERLLADAVRDAVTARPALVPVLQKFAAVVVQDSTTVTLPDALADYWRGGNNRTGRGGQAAVKFQVRFDLVSGALQAVTVEPGRANDHATALQTQAVQPGTLHLRDLGYFDLDVLRDIAQAQAYFVTRLQDSTAVFTATGERLDLAAFARQQPGTVVDVPVTLGVQHRLPVRLVLVRVPPAVAARRRQALRRKARKKGYTPSRAKLALCDWNVFVTNAPATRLSVAEVLALARARWQVECLFRYWKSDGRLGQSRGRKPWRVVCETFAKLLALLIGHGPVLVSCWHRADRSLRKAAKGLRRVVVLLAQGLGDVRILVRAMKLLQQMLGKCARIAKRRGQPSAYQVLEDPITCGHQAAQGLNPS